MHGQNDTAGVGLEESSLPDEVDSRPDRGETSSRDHGFSRDNGTDFDVQSLDELSDEAADDASWAEDLIGRTFGGRYEIERELARGGMGVVYRGRQTNLDRAVVVKVISKYFVDGPEDIARFEMEALGLSKLQHPNIVTIHDFGTAEGLSYIVMEHIEGETLSERLDRHRSLSFSSFVRIAPQVLNALGAAHELGIVHRDIKPANVMLTRRNHQPDFVKVVDFGLVKLIGSGREITGRGLVGTFAYVSPEQILGEATDARSDVYSLGILFYHLLCGRRPFEDPDGMAVLYKHVNEPPPDLTDFLPDGHDIPPRLVDVIHQCLDKDPSRRPRDANELYELLTRRGIFPADENSNPTPEYKRTLGMWEISSREPSEGSVEVVRHSRGRKAAIVAAVCLCVAAAGVVLLLRPGESPTSASASDPSSTAQTVREARTERLLAEAESRADNEQWAESRILLDRISNEVVDEPQLFSRSIALERRLDVQRQLDRAERLLDIGARPHARDQLAQAVADPPQDPRLAQRLAALQARLTEPESNDRPPVESPEPGEEGPAPTVDRQPEASSDAVAKKPAAEAKREVGKKTTSPDKPRQEQRPTKKEGGEAEEPSAAKKSGELAAPRLPATIRIQNLRMLEMTLRRVEGEVIDRNGFAPLDAQNATRLLFKAAKDDLASEPTLNPRKIYYAIGRGIRAGKSRDAIAAELEAQYRRGEFR